MKKFSTKILLVTLTLSFITPIMTAKAATGVESPYYVNNATLHIENSDEADPTVPETLALSYLTYEIEDNEARITACDNSVSGDFTIPAFIGWHPVTTIEQSAFSNCSGLTSITIPEGVTTIEANAFTNCTGLTSVELPNSVNYIGGWAFHNCTSLTSIAFPDGINSIEIGLLYNCYNLTSITIPDSVISIGERAFEECVGLTSITIPDSVISIGDSAFHNCAGLSSVIIPDSISSIGSNVFNSCSALTSVTIPNSVTSIGYNAFLGCISLTSVTIPDSVTSIGDAAFAACESLMSIAIPDSLNQISNHTFDGCLNLTTVTISNSVTYIGEFAFAWCDCITDVYYDGTPDQWNQISIGRKNESMTNAAIHYLATGEVDGPAPEGLWYEVVDGEVIITGYDSEVPGELIIPDNIWGDPVTAIGDYAFCENSALTSVTIPDSVTRIGEGAFQQCSGLTEINIPDSVTDIGQWAFSACTSLTSVTIGDGVVFIGNNAFRECSSLTSVAIGNSVEIIERGVFSLCTGLTSVTFPDSVTEIGNGIFYGCESLEKVTIGNGLTYIGDGAFTGCSALTDVYYNGTQEQFEQIYIGPFNDYMTLAVLHLQYVPGEDDCEHAYDLWEVTVPPSFYAIGWTEAHCSLCGEVVNQIIPAAYAWIPQWNITIEDDFKLNFYLEISESIESTAIVKMIIGDKVETIPISALERAEDFTYIATANISAAQMNENIIVMVINGGEIGCNGIYSAQQYCDTILSDESYSQYHTLVKEMLNYGAMAQLYFNYDTENLVNDSIDDVAKVEVPNTAQTITVSDGIANLDFYGASLVFRDRIAVRYYFTGNVSGCTFTANGNTYTPTEKDGMYYVEIPDILPQDLDQKIPLTVTDSMGNSLSVAYSPMDYIVRMNQKGSYALQNLVKALYNYHLAAKEFSAIA